MDAEEMIRLCREHTLFTWSTQKDVSPLPVERCEGVWIHTADGRRLLDFNSQMMSVNVGHGHPRVREAMKAQIDELAYVAPAMATPVRARVGKMLADLMPGSLNKFFFTNGGAEANENAIKAARLYSGRFKILSRYRSYHGGTHVAMQATGDPRRWGTEPGAPGFVRVMDPWPYHYAFGETEEEITRNNLTYLEEMIRYENPDDIAAMIVEPVTGTNGILAPPKGYLKGLRELLSKYGILMIADEVMAGFGRTGKLFAFQHGGDIVPDMVTMAKGLTSSYAPLGALAVTDPIADYFEEHNFTGGLTYNSHPVSLAAAEAAVQVLRDEGLVEHAAKMEPVMREEMDRLAERHPSVRGSRCIGLFGMVDLQRDRSGTRMAPYNGSHPAMGRFKKYLYENGLFTLVRWGSFMCNPPLSITEEQLREGFAILDEALKIPDEVVEG